MTTSTTTTKKKEKPIKDTLETRLLTYIRSEASFYTLKELESVAKKQFNTHPMSMKQALSNLVDDNQIKSEKIGIQNVYWSFNSDVKRQRLNQRHQMKCAIERDLAIVNELRQQVQDEQGKRGGRTTIIDNSNNNIDNRQELLNTLKELKSTLESKRNKQQLAGLTTKLESMQNALNVHTDNLNVVVDIVANAAQQTSGASRGVVLAEFGIDEDDLDVVQLG